MGEIVYNRQNTTNRIDSLQVLRGIAFIGIFTSHCGIFDFGPLGVSIFFVLSGFLMVYTYYEREVKISISDCLKFSIRKIKKLYPLHIVMTGFALLLATAALLGNATLKHGIALLGKLILNITLLQSWIPNGGIYFSLNGVAWYLSVCLFLYAAFPIILSFIKNLKSLKIAIISMAAIYMVQILCGYIVHKINVAIAFVDNFEKWLTYICPLFRMGDFIIGGVLGYIFLFHKRELTRYIATLLEILMLIAVVFTQILYLNKIGLGNVEWIRYSILYTLISVFLVLLFAINKGILVKCLNRKFMIYLGNISAYTFLIHQIVIKYLNVLGRKIVFLQNVWFLVIVAFIITIACVKVYEICVELYLIKSISLSNKKQITKK